MTARIARTATRLYASKAFLGRTRFVSAPLSQPRASPAQFVARNYDDLVAVSDLVAEHDIWLVTHPEFRKDPKVRATADFLKQVAKGPAGLV